MNRKERWEWIAERYLSIATDKMRHPADRIEACLELGFHYGQDYHNAYKWFREALDISKDEL